VSPSQFVNPYIAGSPVTGTEMFFGREDVFDFVRQNLTGPHANNPIVLYGQRRTGKTSVLYQLHRRLGPGYWCVFIDLHGLSLGDMGQLLRGMAILISRDLQREHQVSVEVPDRAAFAADPATAFESVFLDRVWTVLGDNQLVLMLDEMTYVDEAVQDPRLRSRIFEYLRHLMQHRSQLNFIFSLGSGMEEMAKDYTLLFNVALYQKISFLKRPAARDLITVPARDHYQLTDEAIDRILQVTSGHAYYTQLVCRCVFDAWMRNPVAVIEAAAVDGVLGEAIELGSANLTYVWQDSGKDKEEQALMAGLAAAMRDSGTPVTAEEIRAVWRQADVHLPDQEINRALRQLISREVVAGSGRYSFAVDLQRLWIDKHRRIEWVREDLADALAEWAAAPTLTAQQPDTSISGAPPALPGASHAVDRAAATSPDVLRSPETRMRIQSKVMKMGRRPDNDIIVSDLGVSEHHAELRLSSAGVYQIVDLGSHNGTYVNGNRVNQAELNEGDILAIGHATFRLTGGELIEYVDDGRATFEAHELRVVVHDGGNDKVLLDGITFPLAERSMMAVIGPAGAGKSTLLNALTGKRPATSGNVFYDFRDLYDNYDELRHRIGLVPQETVLHDQLTAQTALGYAAELRFPPDTGEAERNQRVGEVLDELSMSNHAGTRIDRLSGGQKKRVNIGLELLTRPSLLFLDEPTSPLDPHLKRDMFHQMRAMADPHTGKGQSVVVITHDVDVALLDQCDRLLVLQPGGKMAYFGPPAEGLRYFGKVDWADVFHVFADEPDRDFAADFRASAEFMKYVATPISVRQRRLDAGRPAGENVQRRQRSSLSQMVTMARRYRRVMAQDRVFLITTVLIPVLLGVLVRVIPTSFGLVQSTPQPGVNTGAITPLMILVVSSVLSGTALSIREFIKEREIYERERMVGQSPTVYLFSKVIVLSVISVLQTLLVVALGVVGINVPSKGVVFPFYAGFEIFVALAVLSVTSMLIGLAISTLVTKGDQAMPILVGVIAVQVVLSGGLFPIKGALNYVAAIVPARWGLGALASTVHLNELQASLLQSPNASPPDQLWTGNAAHWLTSVAVMILLGVACLIIARLRLSAIGPRKRK
jgi:ABC transport system ATP-binding/permease protein